MNFRKRWKRFWTLDRHSSDGFTLVELIVVIAIIAILAGVGTVGYSGYIKSSKKNADKVLVGDIIRAIETGTNSYAFVNDDSFKMGKIAYPIGFIAIGTNGTSIVTSQTQVYPATEGECKFETIVGLVKVQDKNKSYLCEKQRNIAYKEVTELSAITYCKVHSPAPVVQELTGTYVSGWNHEQGTKQDGCLGDISSCENGCKTFELINTPYPANAKTVTNLDALYLQSVQDTTKCEAAYANQYDGFGTAEVGPAASGDPLYDAIVAAFGNDLSALKLSYDGWTSEEGVSFATLYNSAPVLIEDIETLSGLLATGSKFSADKLGLTQKYNNGEEVLTVVSSTVATTHTPEAWLAWWDNDVNKTQGETAMTWDSYGFGLAGRENYSAARMAYNNAFASYLETRGEARYFDIFNEFYSLEIAGVGLPGLICNDAFTDPESPLVEDIPDEAERERLHKIYKEYVESDALIENGKAVYNILATFNETSDVANAYADMHGGSIYDYYDGYVNEINALYEGAQAAADGGIVIVVVVEDGKLNFLVSPAVANPRNK